MDQIWVIVVGAIASFGVIAAILYRKRSKDMNSHKYLRDIYQNLKNNENPIKREMNAAMQGQYDFEKTKSDDLREFLNTFKNIWKGCNKGWYNIEDIRDVFEHEIECIKDFDLIGMYNDGRSQLEKKEKFIEVINLCEEIVDNKNIKLPLKLKRLVHSYVG